MEILFKNHQTNPLHVAAFPRQTYPAEALQPAFVRSRRSVGCGASTKQQYGLIKILLNKWFPLFSPPCSITSNGKNSSCCGFCGLEQWRSVQRLGRRDPTQKWEMWQLCSSKQPFPNLHPKWCSSTEPLKFFFWIFPKAEPRYKQSVLAGPWNTAWTCFSSRKNPTFMSWNVLKTLMVNCLHFKSEKDQEMHLVVMFMLR